MTEEKTEQRKAKLSDSFGGTVEKNIPEDVNGLMMLFTLKRHVSVSILPF